MSRTQDSSRNSEIAAAAFRHAPDSGVAVVPAVVVQQGATSGAGGALSVYSANPAVASVHVQGSGDVLSVCNGNDVEVFRVGQGGYAGGMDTLAAGEPTFSRDLLSSAIVPTNTGTLRLSFFTAQKSETTTQVRILSGTTAAGATPTLVRIGLYTVDSTGAGTLVASTANDTTLLAAASTAYPKAWSSPYVKVAGQRYALGIIVVTAFTAPTLGGMAYGVAAETAVAPRTAGFLLGLSDLPASFLESALVSAGPTGQRPYAVVLP